MASLPDWQTSTCYCWATRNCPPTWRKTGFKLKNTQAKHRYKLTYLTNQVLLSWHHLHYETSQKLQWSWAAPHVSQFSEPNFLWGGEAFIGSLKKDLFLFESSNFNFNPSKNSIGPDIIVSGQNLHSETQKPSVREHYHKALFIYLFYPIQWQSWHFQIGAFHYFTLPFNMALITYFLNIAHQVTAFLPDLRSSPKI